MNIILSNWVIDVVPPRKARVVTEPITSTIPTMGTIAAAMVPIVEPVTESFESVLSSNHDPVAELVKIGAVINKIKTKTSSRQTLKKTKKAATNNEAQDFGNIISQIQMPISFAVADLPLMRQSESGPIGYIKSEEIIKFPDNFNSRLILDHTFKKTKGIFVGYRKLSILLLSIVGFSVYGFMMNSEVVRNSNLALSNITTAQASLKKFDFSKAADNFKKSHDNFNQASRNLSFVGAGILGSIPGFGELKSAKNIMEAGKLLTSSGQSLSEALDLISKAGSVLDPNETDPAESYSADHQQKGRTLGGASKIKPSTIINQLKTALELSDSNFDKAKALLSDVNDKVIPEDKRKNFIDFKEKLPIFEKTIDEAYKYTDFLERVIGIDKHKKYLILFNNYSELRPTGGFPGTYGVVSFSNGGLENFFVDDVYNLDGQLKRKVVPPKQIQHITPTWGMRDAAWFIDFPASAKKVMEFFEEESGYRVNGVIALNPDIISHILKVVGPIEMPEYNLTITTDNFLASIQEEVEYGDNRIQPKTIIVDLAPRLLERLYSADSGQWMEIFGELAMSLEEKDILLYFEDKELESFAIEENFGGEIKQTATDYLTVNFSNIKGSKTDIVTDSLINIEAREENDHITHKVSITRSHKGGDHELGFYNRQNPSYVRVLIPANAELLNISGNDLAQYQPLVDYQNSDFEIDNDLAEFESGLYFDETMGIDRFEESSLFGQNKMGIGFWMIIGPGKTKTITLEYSTPIDKNPNSFYFQKQPGLDWKNFKFNWNGRYLVNQELVKDIEIKLK